MKRLMLLLSLLLLLSGCSRNDPLQPMVTTGTEGPVPAPYTDEAADETIATLWFRFGTEGCLAAESRELHLSPTAPYEMTLLQALLSGPSAASGDLTSLFPPGATVLSTQTHERRLFVTLSHQIMNACADEPDNWVSSAYWQQEVPLRRRLAMQSIVATVTENCDVDEVVILVEQKQVTSSLRLRESYYMTGASAADLAAPLLRDESLLLTPHRCMELILQCWSERSWQRLYPFVAATDPYTGQSRPDEEAFLQEMAQVTHLTDFTLSGGSVSPDGQRAVFTMTGTVLEDGMLRSIGPMTIRLHRENGQWRVALSQLTEREVSP